ncbi:M20 metallopeptidase family protein [Pedobacter xixiisoli]|uniref:Amidohydrolase n=1 Tax=Pedobacter xixiisoli TaxID=1476464 RepID=A0A285ZYS5_9SPHI|nr:M20 family metallopeptidase [Pedobacter xixiisoli]SOD14808.1 amidohydrolase [Pedobacter xixiisoli]
MNEVSQEIIQLSKAVHEDVIGYRRHLHQNPELSFQEYETSKYIKAQLKKLTIPYEEVANTGVVGIIEGKKQGNGKTIVLRADIDALPIKEENETAFASQREGLMHACGHDFHTANLLGAARILQQLAHTFSGKVLLLFQPAEERVPGGAKAVIASGILEKLGGTISAVFGLHVSPRLDTGQIGLCAGRFMASADEFYLKINGSGGHAAEPNRAVDTIMVAAQLLTTLQQVVSRKANPLMPSVLTFGKIIGNGAANVIPDSVWLEGTFRTMDEEWRKQALKHLEEMVYGTVKMLGATAELEIKHGYPMLVNDISLSQHFKSSIIKHFGPAHLEDVPQWMAAEDFAYYSHKYPSVFFLVGIKNEQQRVQYGLHNAKFDLDEQAFLTAMQAMTISCLDFLENEHG